MATTEHFYAGTGTQTSFPFEFPYLTESDVFVKLYNSSTGKFDLKQLNTSGQNNDYSISNTNIVFNTAPPQIAGVNNIHIYRNTDVETAKAVYNTGSAIRAQDLNNNTDQALYKLQEGTQLITTDDIKDEAIDSSKIKDGTIVDADVSTTAEIAVSKLADGSARQLLQTDAAGTGVEWSSNIDIPGTLDVTGNVDLDANLNVDGATTLDGTTVDGVLDINGSATIDNVQIDSNEINTTSGNLTIDSASGTTIVDDHLNVTGNVNITGSLAAGSINATTLGNLGVGSFLRADANDESTAGTYTLRGPSTGSSANRAIIQGRDLELVFGLGNQDQAQTMQISAQRHGISDGLGRAASINDINLGAGNLGLPHGSTELNSTDIGHVARISLGRAYMTVAKPNNVYSTNHIVMRASYPDGLMFYHPDTTVTGGAYVSTSGGNSYDQNIIAARNAADMRIITGGILAKNKVEIGSSSVTGTLQISGTDVTSTAAEINILDGVTTNTSELNKLDGFTGSAADLNEVVTGKNVVETITGSATDTQLPTAQAVNERIVELVTEVGGFHPIANETSFPTTNPDINDGAGTIVSVKALASNLTSNGSGVATIANGAGSGNTVTINGMANNDTIESGKGILLETTTTLHTYNFHREIVDSAGVANADALVSAFNERYYGPYAANQSTRPSGANRVNGDLYFNTSDGKMKVFNGSHATGTWDDVAAPGNFFINTLSSSSGSGGGQSAFNGVATRFTLSNPPLTAQQLLVSVNGVIQKPNSGTSPSEGFAIDSSDIIFASAPATSAPYFIVTIGSSVNIGTPSNDTVGAAQIIDGSISNAEISSSAAIAKSKLAALDIVNADVNASAAIAKSKLAALDIVNADVNASAAIAKSKLAALDIVNADVNASAAIAGTKVSPDFGTQNIVTTGTITTGTIVGGGDLLIRPAAGNNSIIMQSNNGSETLFKATVNGSVELYHGTSTSEKKFETTSTGATVTGSLGIGNTSPIGTLDVYDGTFVLSKPSSNASSRNWRFLADNAAAGNLGLQVSTAAGGSTFSNVLEIDSSGKVLIGTTDTTTVGTVNTNLVIGSTTNNHEVATTLHVMEGTNNRRVKFFLDDDDGVFGVDSTASTGVAPFVVRITETERMRIDSDGRVGIGTSTPNAGKLVVTASSNGGFGGSLVLENSNASDTDKVGIAFRPNGSATTAIGSYGESRIVSEYNSGSTDGANHLQFHTHAGNGTVGERMRIASDGRVAISSTGTYFDTNTMLEVVGKTGAGPNLVLHRNDTTVSNNQVLAALRVTGNDNDGSTQQEAAAIEFAADGDHANNDKPGRIVFKTTADGGSSSTERLRIDSSGNVEITDGDLKVADGHGIDFSATSDASGSSSELLDDYEEGTWTPTVSGATSIATFHSAVYTKIGRTVHYQFYFVFGSSNSSATMVISGLPFTANSGSGGYQFGTGRLQDQNTPVFQVNANATNGQLYKNSSTTMKLHEGSSKYILISGTYTTS